jgi:murein DD-endopeptidase MepM/ murein hydrolase activator NlpD
MSSLHQDHLLVEGSEPVTGAPTLAPARGTSRRRIEEKATSSVPTQREGKSQRSGTTPSTTDGSPSSPLAARTRATAAAKAAATAKAATVKAATAKAAGVKAATAKAATVKAASARAATAKAATVKAATAARTAAAAKVSHRTAKASPVAAATPVATKPATAATATPAAKPATVKATPAAKPAPAKPTTAAKATPAAKPAGAKHAAPKRKAAAKPAAKIPAPRPTPYKRTLSGEPVAAVEAPLTDVIPAEVVPAEVVTSEVAASEVVASIAEGRRSRFLRRRPPSIRRHPSLYLAAALVGAISVSGFSSGDPVAQATDNMSHSVSIAQELGIAAEPTAAVTETHAAERLGELAVSRNERGAEQAAAAQAQAAADQAAAQAAAEAARPKAVLPVAGARLTSTFGARWGTLHAGIDLAAPMRTPEMAAMDGVVLEAGPASGFGLAVYIQHENGDVTVYGHMDEILVQAGQVVHAGDTIALLGNRGQSTGPHLHFEVHVGGINGQKIDPLPWLRERGIAI